MIFAEKPWQGLYLPRSELRQELKTEILEVQGPKCFASGRERRTRKAWGSPHSFCVGDLCILLEPCVFTIEVFMSASR